jgi:hypothetical protein
MLHHLILSVRWQKTIALTGEHLNLKETYKINSLSLLARYAPGGIWDYVGKFALAKKRGLGGQNILLSLYLNVLLTILSGVVVFLMSLLFFSNLQQLQLITISIVLLSVTLVLLHPKLLEKLLNLIFKLIKRQKMRIDFSYSDIIKASTWFVAGWVVVGTSFFMLISSFSTLETSIMPKVIGIFAISWIVGFLTPIAPNGVGVREATLTLLLKQIMPLPLALVSSIGFRLLIIFGDLVSAGIGSRLRSTKT